MTNVSTKLKLVTGLSEPEQLEWSERLEIGVPLIDEQHKRFFDLAASFGGNGDQVRVMKTLAQMNDYVRDHFRDEEGLMAKCNYPGIEEHRRLHQEFRYMLADMLERARKMTLDQIAEEVRQLINGWLSSHIMAVDQEYVPYVWKTEGSRSACQA